MTLAQTVTHNRVPAGQDIVGLLCQGRVHVGADDRVDGFRQLQLPHVRQSVPCA